LQKYRFFACRAKPILCIPQIEEDDDMSAFWKNLHGLAHGQLFNGGYIAPQAVVEIAVKENARRKDSSRCNQGCEQPAPWPRLAAYR
jgi:hypothetical protein